MNNQKEKNSKINETISNLNMLEPTRHFSKKAENYMKYRWRYPKEVLDYLKSSVGLQKSWNIADIGYGTGILTKILLDNGNNVIGVEPNDDMRNAGEEYLKDYSNFVSMNAKAEESKIKDNSLELITVAQAIHWFNPEKTKIEFNRILKDNGIIFIIFNRRSKERSDFIIDYDNINKKYNKDFKYTNNNPSNGNLIINYLLDDKIHYHSIDNKISEGFESFKGGFLSASFIPDETSENYTEMINELKDIFDKHKNNDKITFEYSTEIYWGHLS